MPLDKSMTREEIIKKEIAAGKPQDQAVAISYRIKGENKKNDTLQFLDTLSSRTARGTQRYASKKNEDEASQEEHDIEKEDLERKKTEQNEDNYDELQRKRDTSY